MKYINGSIELPKAPGLGVALNYDKLKQYNEYFKETGGYQYDRDPFRKEWFSVLNDNQRWATPKND